MRNCTTDGGDKISKLIKEFTENAYDIYDKDDTDAIRY